MLWSRLFFQFFAQPILAIDAWLASAVLGTERIGNLIGFADGSGYMIVSPACTSFGNISFAFLCWVAVTQWANHRWSPIDLLWLSLTCISVVAVNVVRLGITGLSYSNFEAIHNQTGEAVGGAIILVLTVGFSVFGARRELFSRT
jgi:exosortase/archaeosortase family protein